MTEIATRETSHLQIAPTVTRDRLELLKRTIAGDVTPPLTDDELELFAEVANRKGLDPFARQIHVTKRQGKLIIQTGIDGFRLIAERTGRYDGQDGPWWCDQDGHWHDVWLSEQPPTAAKIIAYRIGSSRGLTGIAHWREYAQYTTDKGVRRLNRMWETMKAGQLAKCAEALALRKGFPQDLSGLYIPEEIGGEESPGPAQVTSSPAGPGATTQIAPTHDQVKRLRKVEDARSLVMATDEEFQQTVKRLASTSDANWRHFWWNAPLDVWKDKLHDAITEMSDGAAPNPPGGRPSDSTSGEGRADQGAGEGAPESAMTPSSDSPILTTESGCDGD